MPNAYTDISSKFGQMPLIRPYRDVPHSEPRPEGSDPLPGILTGLDCSALVGQPILAERRLSAGAGLGFGCGSPALKGGRPASVSNLEVQLHAELPIPRPAAVVQRA